VATKDRGGEGEDLARGNGFPVLEKGGVRIHSVQSETRGDGGVENVHNVSRGVVYGDGVSIVGPDCEGCISDCDSCDIVAKVRSDVDSALAPVRGDS